MSHTIQNSIIVSASPDEAWQVAAHEFDRVGDWTSQVVVSKANSAAAIPVDASVGGRVCTAPGFGDVKETITRYNETDRQFTYKVDGLPGFVTRMENTWRVTPAGRDQSQLTMTAEFDTNVFPGAIMALVMKRKLTGAIDTFLEEFKLWVEEREISPAKLKLNAKQARKAA